MYVSMVLSKRAKGLDAWLLAILVCPVKLWGVEEVLFNLWWKDVKAKWEKVKAEGGNGRSDLNSFKTLYMLSNNWMSSCFDSGISARVTT